MKRYNMDGEGLHAAKVGDGEEEKYRVQREIPTPQPLPKALGRGVKPKFF
jgi:hypothetical protein